MADKKLIIDGQPEKKNIHEGHRQRLKQSVLKDPELNSFSDIEVLEYVLTFAVPRRDTNPIAHRLLDKFGSLYYVFSANYNQLLSVSGVTQNAAHLISNYFTIFRRICSTRAERNISVKNVRDAVNVLQPYFVARDIEYVYMLCLDVHENLIAVERVAEGDASSITLNKVYIVKLAMKNNAVSVILAHNHPGGYWQPSQSDVNSTIAIGMTCEAMNIHFSDHIIFFEGGYCSFFYGGLLPNSPRGATLENGLMLYNEPKNIVYMNYLS